MYMKKKSNYQDLQQHLSKKSKKEEEKIIKLVNKTIKSSLNKDQTVADKPILMQDSSHKTRNNDSKLMIPTQKNFLSNTSNKLTSTVNSMIEDDIKIVDESPKSRIKKLIESRNRIKSAHSSKSK